MHPRSVHHRIVRAVTALSLGALVALCCGGVSIAATTHANAARPGLPGTWSGRYGGSYSGSFTLTWKQTGKRLTGSIKLSSPSGSYPITGSVSGGRITFGAVGAGATYTGTWAGKSMSGHYKSVGGGGGTWSAHKT